MTTPFQFDAFAADLAKAIGGKDVAPEYAFATSREILLDEATGLHLWLTTTGHSKNQRLTISAYNKKAHKLRNNRAIKWPEATVSPDRDWKGLVADITRRVVTPAKEADAALAVQLQTEGDERARATSDFELLAKYLTHMRVRPNAEDPTRGADLYVNEGGCYMSGRVSTDGTFTASHVSLTREMLEAINAIIAGAGK